MMITRIGFNGISHYISDHDIIKQTDECIYAKVLFDLKRIRKSDLNSVICRSTGGEEWGLIWATGETQEEARNKACDIYINFLKQKITEIENDKKKKG